MMLNFIASSGWFKQCKTQYSTYNMKVNGESVHDDVKAVEEFLETLDKLMVEKNELSEQILNMNETSLVWKRRQLKKLHPKEAKSMSVDLFGNHVESYKLKPSVI